MRSDTNKHSILFYDGDCPFCSKIVLFLLKRSDKKLLFAPLQGDTAKELPETIRNLDTVVLLKGGRVFLYSGAALRALAYCGILYKFLLILLIIPAFLRNAVYKVIARNRKRIIKECSIPYGIDSERFLN